MAVANNADDYAAARQGIFFPANNNTSADGNLTGQCVTLVKWFMAEMANVPSPFAARGDARYVGDNLVAQGIADVVPAGQQRRGDIVVYKYGQYGHIAVLLSGGRIFQENANTGSAQARRIDKDTVVYASTIVPMYGSLGGVAPSFYRLKTYNDGGADMPIPSAENYYQRYNKAMIYIRGRAMSREEFNANFVGNTDLKMLESMLDNPEADAAHQAMQVGQLAIKDNWQQQIYDLQAQAKSLQAEIDKLNAQIAAEPGNEAALQQIIKDKQDQLDQVTANLTKAYAANDDLKKQIAAQSGDTELLNGFGLWLQKLIARLGVKKS